MKRSRKHSQKAVTKKVKKKLAPKPAGSPGGKIEDVQKLVQLLQVNQVELEHQNQELRMAEQELEASRSKYVNLFDFSPIPYLTLDFDGRIQEVNLSAGKMFGIDRNKLIGKNINSFIPFEGKNAFNAFIRSVFDSTVKQSCKLEVINKDKRVFYVLMEGVKSDDTLESEQRCYIALIDLTEYKKLEDSLKELSGKRKSLNGAGDEFTG